MSLSWLKQWVKKYYLGTRRKSRPVERRLRRTQIGLEVLEDRQLLSVAGPLPVDQSSAAAFRVTGFPSAEVSGQPHSLTITAVSSSGKTATDFQGTIHFSSSDPHAVLPAEYTFKPKDHGRHTFHSVTLNSFGSQSLTATDVAQASISGTESGIEVDSPVAYLTVNDLPHTVKAGQQFQITVTAHQHSGAISSYVTDTIHFRSTDKQAVFTSTGNGAVLLDNNYTFTPNDQGSQTFTVTLGTAGSQAIFVSDTTRAAILTGRAAAQVTPGTAAKFRVTGFPTADVSGVAHAVKVEALDAYGNRATGYGGTVDLSSSDPYFTPPQDYIFTAADKGIHIFHSVKLVHIGSQSLTATGMTTDPPTTITGTESGINVAPILDISVPVTATAGKPFQITVTASDSLGHTDTSFLDTIHFASTDPKAVLPAKYTFTPEDKGSHTFKVTLETAGSQTIFASDNRRPAIRGGTATSVQAGPAATLSLLGLPPSALVGVPQSVTVTAYDAYGNQATSYQGRVHFSSSDPNAGLPADYTFTPADHGSHTFTFAFGTLGTQTLDIWDVNQPALKGLQHFIWVTIETTSVSNISSSTGNSSASTSTSSTSTSSALPAPGWLAAVPQDMQLAVQVALQNGMIPDWVQSTLQSQWAKQGTPNGQLYYSMLFPWRVANGWNGPQAVPVNNWMYSVVPDPQGGLEEIPNLDLANALNAGASRAQLGALLQRDFWEWIIADSSKPVAAISLEAQQNAGPVYVSPQLLTLLLSQGKGVAIEGGDSDSPRLGTITSWLSAVPLAQLPAVEKALQSGAISESQQSSLENDWVESMHNWWPSSKTNYVLNYLQEWDPGIFR